MDKQRLTVGFADIANFMTTRPSTERLAQDLETFYQQAGDRIYAHGGRIVKYIGDSVLFAFDSPKQAVAAAREITGLQIDGCPVYAGLATGEVYQGQVGHPQHRQPDVIGPAVNTAAGLLRKAKNQADRLALDDVTREQSES